MKHLFKSPIGETQVSKSTAKTGNAFLDASTKKDTMTENGAISNSSAGNEFVDDFSNSGSYRNRSTEAIFADASVLWAIDPEQAMKQFLYLRLITRKPKGQDFTDKVMKGQGNRDESLRRLLWVAYNHPQTFYRNLWLVPIVGSFKDLWTLMGIDFKNELKRENFFTIMQVALDDDNLKALVVKYMPQIKAKSKLKTDRAKVMNALAKEFAKFLNMSYEDYRKFKSSNGAAHVWQQQISKGYYDQLNFDLIPGKALSSLVSGKFLKNHRLEEAYTKWIESKPIAKFTGYVYELMQKVKTANTRYQKLTVDKQFDGLVELAKKDQGGIKGNVWVAIDTSGSMTWSNLPGNVTAYDVGVSLGIYFSALNEGAFKDNVIMFDSNSKKLHLRGTFSEKVKQVPMNAMGSTNFQSIFDEIVRIRRSNPNIPIEDYPTTILVISDMQFNPVGGLPHSARSGNFAKDEKTNYEAAVEKMKIVGLPMPNIIWWDVTGRKSDYPSRLEDAGTALLSGFDGAIITSILGGEQAEKDEPINIETAMHIALNQDIFNQVAVID